MSGDLRPLRHEHNPPPYVTKTTEKNEEFTTGSVRGDQSGKPRYDLIPPGPLKRVAELYARGSVVYGDNNWAKGQPTTRFLSSAMRHLEQHRLGLTDEDHLAAVIFNIMGIMHFEGSEMDDLFDWSPRHL